MLLYVCYGTAGLGDHHACANAFRALKGAGYRPRVVKARGCLGTDPLFRHRREVKRLTGNYKVPTLVLDDGTAVDGSEMIIAWARENPAGSRSAH